MYLADLKKKQKKMFERKVEKKSFKIGYYFVNNKLLTAVRKTFSLPGFAMQ